MSVKVRQVSPRWQSVTVLVAMLRFYKLSQVPRLFIFKDHIHRIIYMICVPLNIRKVSGAIWSS